jgi:hypothetical protein
VLPLLPLLADLICSAVGNHHVYIVLLQEKKNAVAFYGHHVGG